MTTEAGLVSQVAFAAHGCLRSVHFVNYAVADPSQDSDAAFEVAVHDQLGLLRFAFAKYDMETPQYLDL